MNTVIATFIALFLRVALVPEDKSERTGDGFDFVSYDCRIFKASSESLGRPWSISKSFA